MINDLPMTEDIAYRFDALYQWLHRRHGLVSEEVTVGQRVHRIFKVGNIDRILDAVVRNSPDPDEHIPYWPELWPAAIALATYIDREVTLNGRSVLDLGCGLGLTGIAARSAGGDVVMTDIEPDALRLAELNWINNFATLPAVGELDWRSGDLQRRFDVIIASDVAYEEKLFWPLLDTFRKHLTDTGEIYLSEPNRPIAGGFFDLLTREGFTCRPSSQIVTRERRELAIAIYHITRR